MKIDLLWYRIVFVICGRIMMVFEYWCYYEKMIYWVVWYYGFFVLWLGFVYGFFRNFDLDKYVVDFFEDMMGVVNYSCELNIIVEVW